MCDGRSILRWIGIEQFLKRIESNFDVVVDESIVGGIPSCRDYFSSGAHMLSPWVEVADDTVNTYK